MAAGGPRMAGAGCGVPGGRLSQVKYVSTRDTTDSAGLPFCDILLEGLAPGRRAVPARVLPSGGRRHARQLAGAAGPRQRLSSLERFFAKNFMGAAIFNEASWDEAERLLRVAVDLRPQWIYHRLDLALIMADRSEWNQAKLQLDAIAQLPPVEPMDAAYKRQALALAARVATHLKP